MAGVDRIEAAVRAGEVDRARAASPRRILAKCAGAAWVRAVALHGRALLADNEEEAERLFEAALGGTPRRRAFECAPSCSASSSAGHDDRVWHASTFGGLDGFGVHRGEPWAERARVELRASGQDGASSSR